MTEPFISVPEPLRFPAAATVFVASERTHIPAHVVSADWSGSEVVGLLCGQKRAGGFIVSTARALELEATICPPCARIAESTPDGAS